MTNFRNIAAATLALALLAAPAFAADVPAFDEWNQPIMTQGAKGGATQATTPANFQIGVPASSTAGGDVAAQLKGSEHWVVQPEVSRQTPLCGSQYMDR